jgi:hypothetical protein
MTKVAIVTSSMMAAVLICAVVTIDQVVAQNMFADTRAIAEFQRAADRYAFLHRQIERHLDIAHWRSDVAVDASSVARLAAALVAEKPPSRPALFTPAAASAFRQVAAHASRAPGCDAGELRSGAWEVIQVNSPASGMNSISRCIAVALPDLPPELEYRSAGTVLVVVDAHANLVVDVLPALLAGSELR